MPPRGDVRSAADCPPRGEHVYAAPSHRHGLGVFAAHELDRGTVIESCPVLVVPGDHIQALEQCGLRGYIYEWEGNAGIAFGFGSLYNHSFAPNAEYEPLFDEKIVQIRALRVIRPDEEITVNYVRDHAPDALWFTANE